MIYSKDLLSLSALFLIVLLVAEAPNGALSERSDTTNNLGKSEVDRSASTTNNNEVNSILNLEESADDDNEENDQHTSNKFSWAHHPDDHSIYSQRSLMSSDNIVHDASGSGRKVVDVDGEEKILEEEEEFDPLKTKDFAEKEWQLMFRYYDKVSDSLTSSILQQIGKQTNIFEEIMSRLKPECRRDIYHAKDSVKQHKLWALRMVDSIGKIPSGITYGKFSSPGDYEECLSVKVDEIVHKDIKSKLVAEHHKFRGQYCLLDFRLPLPERPPNKLLSIHDPVVDLSNTDLGREFPELKNYSGYASVFYEVGYMHAFCLPSTCQVQDLTRSIGKALEGLHIIVNNTVDCETKHDEPLPLTLAQIISLTFLTLLFTNATIASFVYYKRHSKGSKRDGMKSSRRLMMQDDHDIKKKEMGLSGGNGIKQWATRQINQAGLYADCFSVQSNFARLTKPDPRGLTFVHYTRIVAMGLTVITHTAGLGTLQAITKPADASNSEQIFRDFIPQMLANAFSSIQIFFFMAGFMLVISTYPSIGREKGRISFVEYAIKRAIRLMPGLAATICMNFLWPLIVDGPMLSYFYRLIVTPCESNWWRTMAFLSNFDHVEKMCLRHSYFSASDYQLHIMAFPLLILLYKQPVLSLFIAGLLTVVGFAAQVIMILTKTVLPFMMVDYIDKEAFFNVVHYIHHPVWNHMSAFFYGFIIGYFVVKQIRISISDKTIKILWYTILPAGIASIFAPYFWNHYKRPIFRWQMVLYVLFDRFILLTTCAWLSYASMVLARKPQRKSSTAQPKPKLPNLPAVVSLDSTVGKPEKPITDNRPEVTELNATLNQDQSTKQTTEVGNQNLKPSPSGSTMPRQRSSPNFLYKKENETDASATTMRPAISSLNVNQHGASSQVVIMDNSSTTKQAEANQSSMQQVQQQAKKKSQAPISNVNTLCLVLSRLTFQLYLFNMVVLWIDVNHSKYNWFFSYYFIITKALAVYICSSILAMVFFVTLESPSLTIYIMWVKSRAQSAANRLNAREQQSAPAQNKQSTTAYSGHFRSTNANSQPPPSELPTGIAGGLSMRLNPTSTVSPNDKPAFSFIDLTSRSTHSGSEADPTVSDQTKM